MKEPTEKRKADRLYMAAELEKLCARLGVRLQRIDGGDFTPRRIKLELWIGKYLHVYLNFDGHSSSPDVHIMHWTMNGVSELYMNTFFFESVNEYHGQKATVIKSSFSGLCEHIEAVVEGAANGTAFTTVEPIHKRASFAAREAACKSGLPLLP